MKRYSSYKESGIPWVGEIPAHWEIRTLSQLSYFQKLSNKSVHHQNLLSLSYGRIIQKDIGSTFGLLPASFDTYQIITDGDIVLRLTDLQNDQKSLRVGISNQVGIITSAYIALHPRDNVTPRYLYYLLHSYDILKVFYSRGNGIRQNLNWTELRKILCLRPRPNEQEAIVSFLDSKVEKIDGYIGKLREQIAHLEDLKQSLISRTVTRGLDPDAPVKPSGIPWIGEIPNHWIMQRSKTMFERMSREVRPQDEIITCFRDGEVTLRKNRRTEGFTNSLKEIGYQGIRQGDLVIHKMDAFAGAIGVSDSDGKGTPVYICLQPKTGICNKYYAYLLREMARSGYIKSLYKGIRERSSDFTYETFAPLHLPIPPISEQETIVSYLEEQTAKIDDLKAACEHQASLMEKYKQRLISDAVFGRINVLDE